MKLILLIGTNPLPNYVVGKYFLNNYQIQKVFLVHSLSGDRQHSTLFYAQQIAELLTREFPGIALQFNDFGVDDVSNPASIAKVIKKIINDSPGNIHLDYTGGTKTMGVHSFDALKSAGVEFSYSYLDARKFQIVINENERPVADLREMVKISFPQLMKLHGYERKNSDTDFMFSGALNRFKEFIANETINEYFNSDGYDRTLFLESNGSFATKISRLSHQNMQRLKAFKPNHSLVLINESLPDEYKLFIDNQFNENLSNNQFKALVKDFLDGKWFEEYVFEELKNSDFIKDKNFEILTNWVIKKPGWTGNQEFEIDVLLLNGYQLCGISCTTSQKKDLCKSKGFEIFLRTKQIGGDEAKAILISRASQKTVEDLQRELQYDTGSPRGGILVLGLDHWKTKELTKEIKNFINS